MDDLALRPYRLLSLCAGTGALDLGITIARGDARTVCYVERGAYQAELLAARMEAGELPAAPVWSDLGTFDPVPWRGVVDCVTSGDPCQPNSNAGPMLGADDERWLLDRVINVVDAVRPDRFFRENVPGNAHGQLECLVPALEGMGYRVACGIFSARSVGASHGRDRLFVMADRDGPRSQVAQQPGQPGPEEREFEARSTAGELRGLGMVDADRGDRVRLAADQGRYSIERAPSGWSSGLGLFAPGPRDDRWPDLIRDAPGLKPAIRRVADGVAHRMDRLEAAGNGVVSLAAARAWLGLEARLGADIQTPTRPVRLMEGAQP